MKQNPLNLVLLFLGLTLSLRAISQSPLEVLGNKEDALVLLFDSIVKAPDDTTRMALSREIGHVFKEAFRLPESFDYPFAEVTKAGLITASDLKVRMVTWNIALSDGTYRYFGLVLHRQGKKEMHQITELTDRSAELTEAEKSALSPSNWFGALYYEVVSNQTPRGDMYTLLGWDGNDLFTNKRIIDVLIIAKNGMIQFGAPVFVNNQKTVNRIIFEYSKKASMTLRYEPKSRMIVFDHLAPPNPELEGNFSFYGPDFSYDGLRYEKTGFWIFESNIDVKSAEKSKTPANRKVNRYN